MHCSYWRGRSSWNLDLLTALLPPVSLMLQSKYETYNKCVECYNHMMSIRAFLLKRQTVQGKMGTVYRELVILMQAFE
ncbi:Katanin p80 WD40 repeat-containing subunit B1 [Portunus trituberculatus]|uniref:Katanin p80 WD40 repeat-containing subunit B1 n=1 Tax=Portunus trituberculatus TaxID=210409 RepID=A0A5B7CSG9_PORTR|nr:Katanin p80 WD40 repeat-containing subunit B1 [Portunus trituberculatus]